MTPTPLALEPGLAEALATALDDEYRARATYETVIGAFGPVPPFSRIVGAEARHIAALEAVFQRYGLPLPPDRWRGRVAPPPSLAQACRDGVQGEIGNYRMYDRLLGRVSAPDVRAVFTSLRSASACNHLPAFEACAEAYAYPPAPGAPMPTTEWSPLALGALAGAALGLMFLRRPPA